MWAFQTIEDYTDSETGHLVWVEQSDKVTFDAKRYVKKSIAAVERKTKGSKSKAYKAQDGERWRTVPRVMGGGDMPTLSEWIEQEQKKSGLAE